MFVKRLKLALFIILLSLIYSPLVQSKFLFNKQKVLEIKLEFNFSKLLLEKKSLYWKGNGNRFLNGQISFNQLGVEVKKTIQIQNGGDLNFFDELPPLILKFKKI